MSIKSLGNDKGFNSEKIQFELAPALEQLSLIDPSVFNFYDFKHYNFVSGYADNEKSAISILKAKIGSLGGTHIAWRSLPEIYHDYGNKLVAISVRFSLYGCAQ